MKHYCFCFLLLSLSMLAQAQQTKTVHADSSFTLSYAVIGFGGNMFQLQPAFSVNGTKFVYTEEEMWIFKDVEKAKPDTLSTGVFRLSTIDSIVNIMAEVKGTSVYKFNSGITSGGEVLLEIATPERKLKFTLDNAFDSTARKIVDLLNNYIPEKTRRLWISSSVPNIVKIK